MLVVVYDDSLCKKLGIYKLVEDKDITEGVIYTLQWQCIEICMYVAVIFVRGIWQCGQL